MRRLQLRRHHAFGQAMAEFAIVIPIFALLLLMLWDFGRVIYTQNAIQNGAREGTRIGSVSTEDLSSTSDWEARYAAIRAAARSMQAGVAIADAEITGCDSAEPCMQGSSCPVPADPVTGTCFYTCAGAMGDDGCLVVVEVNTSVPLITPLVSNFMGGSFDLNARSEALVQS